MNAGNLILRCGLAALMSAAVLAQSQADEYKLGYVTDLSGPLANSYTPVFEGFMLHMQSVNERGGINGRQVEVKPEDDRLNAQRAVSLTKKLVESEDVLGVFGLSVSSLQGPVFKELRKLETPGVSAFSGIMDTMPPAKPYSYSTGAVFQVAGEALGALTPRTGVSSGKVVGMTIDTVGGRAALEYNRQAVEAQGYSWDQVIFPIRTADFTPHAQAVVEKDPDVVVGHYGTSQNIGVIPALRKSGFDGPYIVAVYGVTEDAIRKAAEAAGTGENLYTVGRYATVSDDVGALGDIRAAAKEYGTSTNLSRVHVTGWVLAQVAAEALRGCADPCSGKKLDKALQSVRVDTSGLTGGPIEFTTDNHYGPSYWRLHKWQNDELVPVGDWLKKTSLKYGQN